ncbi:hypothetical protein [Hymenobacter latericus]|uniref:hypothetical protein n=1 Tax=Hymenobacter sp. YIM 151858-1 TaxID=2987688 RepID=UPI00222807F7|nr:hypothetical protein [Hymenobacter sp. YIM 151858-1]UYZ58519.1 hypothetical protein OIS50_15835 [Hymenobacter sp. YIM 151858-1]
MNLSRRTAHWAGMLAVIVIGAVVLAAQFPFVLAHPDEYFFQPAGDGLQSYYATAYYAFYDKGAHFSGMNYPYGENFTYPNLQPLIAWVLGVLQRQGLQVAIHTVGITNLLALLAILLTPPVIYLILRRLQLSVVYSVLLAVLIGFLSPQIQRLGDHMSLSYPCLVPWLWYCILRIMEAPRRWVWHVVFIVSSLLTGFVMAYFLACGAFFLLAHVLVLAVQKGQKQWRDLAYMTLTALLPLILFRGWLWFTDPTTDRPPNPYGFLVYMTKPRGLFTPALEPMRTLWTYFFPTKEISYEAMSYVGLVGTGVLAAALLRALRHLRLRHKQALALRRSTPHDLRISLWAGGLLVLFAAGIPFIFSWFSPLIDYLGPLKQFRALGRFAWPFYYVVTTYAAYYLYQVLRYQQQRRVTLLAAPWVPLLLLVWGGEAWINISTRAKIAEGGGGARSYFRPPHPLLQQLQQINRSAAEFQAILPLPYFNNGSDKIFLPGSHESIYEVHKLSLATGLPQLSSYVSRPSVSQVLEHVQLLSSPLLPKPLLQRFPSQKPILLLVTPTGLSEAEQRIIALAKPLVQTPQASLYELPLAALGATTTQQELQRGIALWPTLPERPNGLRTTTGTGVLLQDFAQSADRRGRLAPGALYEPAEKFSVLYDGPVPAPADTGKYEVSLWMHGMMDHSFGNMQVKQYMGNDMIDHQVTDGHRTTEIDGVWVRVAVPIRVRPGTTRLEVLYDNKDLLVDDLLIRPIDTDVYWRTAAGQLVLNGYRLGQFPRSVASK